MKRLRAFGSTAMAILAHYYELLHQKGISLVVCGIEDELKKVMTGSGLRNQIGEQNIFYADNKLFQSTELALARAWSIVEMERRRDRATATEAPPPVKAGITADDIMTRRCIRFGNQHQLREALWLMSEMYRRTPTYGAPPLFLQDLEGRLAGELQASRILQEMASHIRADDGPPADDDALGDRLARSFTRPIAELADPDIPIADTGSSLETLLHQAVETDAGVIPVCDAERRILGLVDESQILRALGRTLKLTNEDSPSTENEIVEVGSDGN
jgi:hypothetical protein